MILGYIRSKISVFIMYFASAIGFPLLLGLKTKNFSAAMGDTLYGIIFITLILIIWLIIDSGKYFKKHLALERMRKELEITSRQLPNIDGLIDEDYCKIIEKLYSFIDETLESKKLEHSSSMNYFLRWFQKSCLCFNVIKKADSEGLPIPKKELVFAEHYLREGIQYIKSDYSNSKRTDERCSVDEIVRVSVQKFSPLFLDRKISVGMKRIGLEATVDRTALCFIIDELLLNALYNTDNGSIKIYSAVDYDGNPQLIIEDTGSGISREDIDYYKQCGKIYEPEKTSGLGLFTLKQVASSCSVAITYAVEDSGGTLAKITLP